MPVVDCNYCGSIKTRIIEYNSTINWYCNECGGVFGSFFPNEGISVNFDNYYCLVSNDGSNKLNAFIKNVNTGFEFNCEYNGRYEFDKQMIEFLKNKIITCEIFK